MRVPDAGGDFMVDGTVSVWPRKPCTLEIDGNLRVIGTTSHTPIVIQLRNVASVSVLGAGKVIGDRYSPLAPNPQIDSGRHGYGIAVWEGTSDIHLNGVEYREHYADGVYVQGVDGMSITNVKSLDNARNGMSLIGARNLLSAGNIWGGTHSESPYPQAGIDMEPDPPVDQHPLVNITITKDSFLKNKGAGIYVATRPDALHGNINIFDNFYDQHYRDGSGPPIRGANDGWAWFVYNFRFFIPGYDWNYFPTGYRA